MTEYTQFTRPWRTLVVLESFNDVMISVTVPAWDARRVKIDLDINSIPGSILNSMRDDHLYFLAHVNIGAEKAEDLIFTKWEIA